jgi:non-specific serine/threonine protein kinase
MASSSGQKAPSEEVKESSLKAFYAKLRKRHIIETFAGFIAGGWLVYEIVERVLVLHYKFPETLLDITLVTLVAAMLCTILWRWFRGTEKRPENVKAEVLLVPLIILVALAIDLNLILQMAGIPGRRLLIGIVAFLLGITWVIFKLSQWAIGMPETEKKEVQISPTTTAKPEKSIIVLPFTDLSPQKDQEYFCDGMTEEIITDLSHIHELRVISRNSAMMLKGTPKDTGTIGRELNVQYALEGSVRKAGNELRITAQLIDTKSDAHLWAEKYGGTLDDVFALQERLSRRIVDALKITLTADEERRLALRPISDLPAYDAFLRAKQEFHSFTKEGIDRGLHLTNEALVIVGDNAMLYAVLGQLYYASYDFGISHDDETLLKAEKNARKALDLNPDESQALLSMGLVRYKRGNLQEFVRFAKRATELERNGDALALLAFVLSMIGRTTEARRYADQANILDPLTFWTAASPGFVDLFEGKLDAALFRIRDSMTRLTPGEPFPLWWTAQAAAFAGQEAEAQDLFKQVAAMPAGLFSDFSELFSRALYGDRNGVLDWLSSNASLREMAKTDEWYPCFLASCLAHVGEMNEALDWIEQAISWGFSNHRFLSQYNRFLAPLHGEPRFEALLERARKKEQALEV